MAGSISSHFTTIVNIQSVEANQYSDVAIVVVVNFYFFNSTTYQHPEIVVNIVQVHLPRQTLEFSHQDSSMLPSEHTHVC